MQQHSSGKRNPLNSLTDTDLRSLYLSEHKPSHHQKWNDFADAYPELARTMLARSHFVREGTLDSGDAYLHAAADMFVELRRIQSIEDLQKLTRNLNSIQKHSHTIKGNIPCELCK